MYLYAECEKKCALDLPTQMILWTGLMCSRGCRAATRAPQRAVNISCSCDKPAHLISCQSIYPTCLHTLRKKVFALLKIGLDSSNPHIILLDHATNPQPSLVPPSPAASHFLFCILLQCLLQKPPKLVSSPCAHFQVDMLSLRLLPSHLLRMQRVRARSQCLPH